MDKDPTNQFIKYILENCEIKGKDILEMGCGSGRITHDLSMYAKRIVAVDPDEAALNEARKLIQVPNVQFVLMPGESPDSPEHSFEITFPPQTFDVVVYGLSLHHTPIHLMKTRLKQALTFLKADGKAIIIEPDRGGTLIEAEERFGVGDGDEREAKEAALDAIRAVREDNWVCDKDIYFHTLFFFDSEEDFLENLLPGCHELPQERIDAIKAYLKLHTSSRGIILTADRRMNVLHRLSRNESM